MIYLPRSIVDSGGVWTRFQLLRFDLTKKNRFSSLVNPQGSGKRFKSFLRAWTITGVSLVSILGPGPREINLERTFLKNLENLSGKKVNNGINKPSATNVLKKFHRKIKPNGPFSSSYRLPNLLESLRKNPTCNLTYSTNPGDKIKIKHEIHQLSMIVN